MAITQVYVDPAIAGNSGTGTIGDPYGDLQYALDTQARDAVNGDQFNIKAGTAEVLAASLTLATYGTPTAAAPLIFRGYAVAANDRGVGEIDCGGFTAIAGTPAGTSFVDLHLHTFGNSNGITLNTGGGGGVFFCEVDKGASSPSGKYLIVSAPMVLGCYLHDTGTNGRAALTCLNLVGNYAVCGSNGFANTSRAIINNVVVLTESGQGIVAYSYNPMIVRSNAVYSSVANTGSGIYVNDAAGRAVVSVTNNVICGFSGAGGEAILLNGENLVVLGHNAFYNNTANMAYGADGDPHIIDLTANDVALAADPFTDAANGDFSLTAAAKAALAAKGFPLAYLGAHANTVSNLNIGPIQMAAGGGGASIYRRVARLLGG